jgi:predicted membrane-bound mannosyltransferase
MDHSSTKSFSRAVIIVAVAVTVLAGCLRFFRLGDWCFENDEAHTFYEIESLLHLGRDHPPGGSYRQPGFLLTSPMMLRQNYNLPRLIPLGYLTLAAGHSVFGQTEFGSRALMAIIGTANVLLLFVGLVRPLGLAAATASAVLLAIWPEHIYFSQSNRFYAPAAFFTTLCMVSGAHAVQRRSTGFLLLAIFSAFAALFCHSIQGALLFCLLAGIVVAAAGRNDAMPRFSIPIGVLSLCLGLSVLVFYLLPLEAFRLSAGDFFGVFQ